MKSFLKLWPFVRSQWKFIVGSLILAIPLSAIRFSPAPLMKFLTDEVLIKKDMHQLVLLALGVVCLYIGNLVIRFSHTMLARIANERIMRDIRERLFSHYLNLSNSFFNESSVGILVSRVTNDVFYVSQGTINLANLTKESVTFLGLFIYAARLNLKLLILTLTVGPLLIWIGKRTGVLMKGYAHKMQEANGNVYASLQEAFSGFRILKAFGLEKFAFTRFKDRNDQYVKFALKAAKLEEFSGPVIDLMSAISVALIIYVGGSDVISGKLTQGDLLAFFTCFGLMIQPIRSLNEINMKLNNAGASADRINETLSLKSDILEIKNAKTLEPFKNTIQFNDIGFKYAPELPWVIQEINLNIRRGQTVALVGASGQGKSTLLSLIPRFYDATQGSVLIDGQDIREVTLQSLRSQLALVTQDVFLFNDTVYNNIACGKLAATPLEVNRAAELAYALPFIEKLPQGFDTIVGDRGQKLSGGERQRISIARAILRDAPILLLDEATSSLDSESERLVQEALETLMKGRTTLVVAHRLSTIRNADRILVLSNGRICEEGTHDSLLSLNGEYARFYRTQSYG